MKEISFTVQCPEGLHARPAGMLTKKLKDYTCDVTLAKDGTAVNARKLFAIMTLLVKTGDQVVMTFNGPDEELAAEEILAFSRENL